MANVDNVNAKPGHNYCMFECPRNMPSPTPEVTFKDRSVHEIHLENGFTYVIEQNLKHFASVINVLAKFSEQILLQPTDDGLVLSASSSARSAYAKVKLCRQFFERLRARENLAADGEVFCRLATKSLVHIFKGSAHSFGHLGPSCSLELDPQADFAYVHLQCMSSVRRCFVLSLREHAMVCDNVFNERQRLKNRVTAHAKLLATLLGPLDCSDLELVALPGRFTACRYIPREDYGKVRRTEVQIPVDHCEQYRIDVPTRVVVNLRELRPILQFADLCGMSVTLHFDRAGRPLIVVVEENVDFAAEFVLGTLDEQLPIQDEQQQPQQSRQEQNQQQLTPILLQQPQQQWQPEESHQQQEMSPVQQQQPRHERSQQQQLLTTMSLVHQQQQQPEQEHDHSRLTMSPVQQQLQQQEQEQVQHQLSPMQQIHQQRQPEQSQQQLVSFVHPQEQSHTQLTMNRAHQQEREQDQQQLSPVHQQQPEQSEQCQHQLSFNETPPLSQGQLLERPAPTLEFVDPNEVPLQRYMMSESFHRHTVVPRPEGMNVWEQESDVGSRVQSSFNVSRGGGGDGGTIIAAVTGWMSKRSASQRRKQ